MLMPALLMRMSIRPRRSTTARTAETVDDRADGGVHRGFVGDVHGDGDGFATEAGQLIDRPMRFVGIARRDGHARPGLREPLGHAEADPAVASGHHRYLALEVEHED